MLNVFEVKPEDIERLDALQLTELLRRLLYEEAKSNGIPLNSVSCSTNISAPDEGSDAEISWDGKPDNTEWLPYRCLLFQCKATDMPPNKCRSEILTEDKSDIKPRIKNVLEKNGHYILFYYQRCNSAQEVARISAFRDAIAEVNPDLSKKAKILIYDANKISEWVSDQLSTIILVCKYAGHALPNGILTWNEWDRYKDNINQYISDTTLSNHLKTIKGINKPGLCCRITGLSGLGKTRLVLEAFRPDKSNPDDIQLSNSVVYFDIPSVGNGIVSDIISWRQRGINGILVADNCPLEVHKRIKNEIEHSDSKFSFISIDFNPEKDSGSHPYIELKPPISDEVIKGILQKACPELRDQDRERIIAFAQGFPKIAVLLGNSALKAEPDIVRIKDEDLIDKLLWGRRLSNQSAKKAISACSLFEHFGFDKDLLYQRQFIAENICELSDKEFYSYCQEFREHGIIDIRYRLARVIPRPLAIYLASEWWQKYPPEKFIEFISNIPREMQEAFWDQTSNLQFLPKAREMIEKFVGENSPFGLAEVLNTEMGSRLFRSFVEVNPESTSEAIYREFALKPREELLTIGPGRRNLVWALEKLCYWRNTFPKSWQTLLKFAAAENETWSNNSTGLFLRLFHVLLSGTEVPCSERLYFVQSVLETADDFEKKILLNALGEGLKYGQFMRMGGVEKQGSRPALKDWQPKSGVEIVEYWKGCISLLIKFGCKSNETEPLVQNKISENISSIIQSGLLDYLAKEIRAEIAVSNKPWNKIKNSLENYLSYNEESLSEKAIADIRSFMSDISPKDLIDRARDIVSIPEWIHRKDKNNECIFVAEENARKFPRETYRDKNAITTILPFLLTGEQRQASTFGNELYSCFGFNLNFALDCMNILSTMQNPNASLLGGYLFAAEQDHPDEVYGFILSHSKYQNKALLILELIRFIRISKRYLNF